MNRIITSEKSQWNYSGKRGKVKIKKLSMYKLKQLPR